MKLLTILLLSVLTVSATTGNSYSQQIKFSLKLENVALSKVFEEIEGKSEFILLYDENTVDVNRKVTVQVENTTVDQILDQVFVGTNNTYKIYDRQIVILEKEKVNNSSINNTSSPTEQQKAIRGKVTDTKGEPLPGVSVVLKGTTIGITTDLDGNYVLEIPDNAKILSFSFVGMKSQEIAIGNQTQINVVLEEENIGINEVIAVGYGSVKKSDLTAAISSVEGEKIADLPAVSPVQAMQGLAAGVNIISSAQPGDNGSINIRGVGSINNSSSPLIIIDGVIGDMNTVTLSSIKSIEVLKDAAYAAAYGARAANGVIIVTTKRGRNKKGTPVTFSLNSSFGLQEIAKKPQALDILDYAKIVKEANDNAGLTVAPAITDILADPDYYKSHQTDWVDAILRVGKIQKHEFSASGGSENANFFMSLGYAKQEGTIITTGYDQLNFRANSDYTKGRFKVGESLGLAYGMARPFEGGNVKHNQVISAAIKMPPEIPIYDDNNLGGYAGSDMEYHGSGAQNPVADLNQAIVKRDKLNATGNIYAEYEFIKGLKYKLSAGVNGVIGYNSTQHLPYELISWNYYSDILNKNTAQSYSFTIDNIITYDKKFNDHNLSLLGAYNQEHYGRRAFGVSVTGSMLDNSIPYFNQFTDPTGTATGEPAKYAIESFLGRASYDYKGRYYLTGVIRRDASTRFGPNSKVGIFPSVSGAWRLSEENFFSSVKDVVNNFKLRGSYGTVGRMPDDYFAWQSTATSNNVVVFGDDVVNGTLDKALFENSELKWETETQTNVGFDLSMMNSAFNLSFDYYNRVTKDMLLERPFPRSSGWVSSQVNLGSLQNRGFELVASYNGNVNDFKYEVNGNLSMFKNKVLDIGGKDEFLLGQEVVKGILLGSITRTVEGMPYGSFYGYEVEGIYQSEDEIVPTFAPNASVGDVHFKDLKPDGYLTDEDKTFIGNPFPKYTYALNMKGSYKNFDLSLQWYGVQDVDIFNFNKFNDFPASNGNMDAAVIDRWTPNNHTNKLPRAILGDPNGNWQRSSTIYVEDGSYLKLKYLTLGYSVNKKYLDKLNIGKLRVYVQGENLLTFTKYSGLDPEIGDAFYGRGVDAGNYYPLSRKYVVGVQINF